MDGERETKENDRASQASLCALATVADPTPVFQGTECTNEAGQAHPMSSRIDFFCDSKAGSVGYVMQLVPQSPTANTFCALSLSHTIKGHPVVEDITKCSVSFSWRTSAACPSAPHTGYGCEVRDPETGIRG